MRIPVIFSVTFHILVLGSMWVTLPDLLNNKPKNEEPIIVELVALEEDLTSLKEVKSKPKKINKEKQSIKSKPIVKPVSQIQEAQNKEVVEIFEPKQKPKVKKNIIKDNYIDQTKLRPRLKPKPPKKVKDFDTNRISLLIDKSRKKIDEDKNIEKKKENNFLNKPKLTDGVLNEIDKKKRLIKNARISSRLTMRDIDLIRYQIEKNWTPPSGARDAVDLVIKLRIGLNLDGTLRGVPVIVNSGKLKDTFFRAAADSAIRAVYKAQPFTGLPKAKYDAWRDITLTFNPKQLLGG